jgi:rhamnogalacturonan endolyase
MHAFRDVADAVRLEVEFPKPALGMGRLAAPHKRRALICERTVQTSTLTRLVLATLCALTLVPPAAGRHMEALGRGFIVVAQTKGSAFLSWRLLGTDSEGVAFNVYRVETNSASKLNVAPLTNATSFTDEHSTPNARYFVRSIVNGIEGETNSPIAASAAPYFPVPLKLPPGYTPNDGSVGDLDGDGEYEIVLKCEQRPRDTASLGLTGETILQAYKLNGTLLWTINLGRNIREGAHYTQFMVYDLDGDGIAEIACKTADATVDGRGKVIGDANADWRETNRTARTFGRVLRGPEFLTIFDGRNGAALVTTNYVPTRGDLGGWGGTGGNGGNDNIGNRADRFLACVAYLDGKLPSLVMCRGYYGRSVLAAWDWRGGKLTQRWVFDSTNRNNPFSGQGAHSVSVADVDADGRDEIVYHSMVVDDDGRGLFSTGLRHGDALHVGDFDPSRPGLEVFGVHESEGASLKFQTPGTALYDARTGAIIWSHGPGEDVPRCMAADIDPRHPGAELWSWPAGLRTGRGERIGNAPRSANFAVWWDGDLLREILDRNVISKWEWTTGDTRRLLTAEGCSAINGSKGTPVLSADLFGDWREEVIWRSSDNRELRIYSTTIPTTNRLTTLMHDSQYRVAIAWQNVGYNQPPHPSFFLGEGMRPHAKPQRR